MMQNYFKLLDLPPKLKIDYNKLKKNYFNLLRVNSKDATITADQQKKKRALIKKAYDVLADRITRIEHLLEINGFKVANDNKVPLAVAPFIDQIETLKDSVQKDKKSKETLKKIHADIISEFSTISIELARLENAWDLDGAKDPSILKKLKRKMAAFTYIKNMEQDLRTLTH